MPISYLFRTVYQVQPSQSPFRFLLFFIDNLDVIVFFKLLSSLYLLLLLPMWNKHAIIANQDSLLRMPISLIEKRGYRQKSNMCIFYIMLLHSYDLLSTLGQAFVPIRQQPPPPLFRLRFFCKNFCSAKISHSGLINTFNFPYQFCIF